MKALIFSFLLLFLIPSVLAECIDMDQDGFGAGCMLEDCDDSDPERYPGAIEVCNGLDDDCDGIRDNLFNSTDILITKCRCSESKVPIQERCDGIDNNCNGEIDEGFATLCTITTGFATAEGLVPKAVSKSPKLIISILVLIVVFSTLGYVIFSFTTPKGPEDLAAHYHRKGELAYESGNYNKAKHYFERASDIRRRNL